jgi:hypothetical protein
MTYTVEHNEIEKEFVSLDMAMDYAKTLDVFVVIKGDDGLEIAGKFGVGSVKNGKTPDGIAYTWNKESRIGRVKKRKELICQQYF